MMKAASRIPLTRTARLDEDDSLTAAPPRHRRILVVDDEEHIRVLLREVVQTLGHRAILAANGVQALEKLSGTDVDLVITDINMPGLSGLDLLRRIKAELPDLPVILITGYGTERAERAAQELRADGFLGKPFRVEDMRHCIARLIG
ncbi:MAG: response regulator [Candidatus Zixiibacteriota bacterium]|nr:MAG: response regulator [candidate division Zixibacteria bacterium]